MLIRDTAHSAAGTDALRAQFIDTRGYLAACTVGLPMQATRDAVIAEITGVPNPADYERAVDSTRRLFAQLVQVAPERIAIASQTSVQVGLIAASVPDGAEILVPENEFSSLVLPFVHAGRGIHVRAVPLGALAAAITPDTHLVAFSSVQSATGEVADIDAIVSAAARDEVLTVCDATQAVGWMPVDAARFDALLCHAYKWLCAPRGVAFMALSEDFARALRPVHAGWYAGDDPWASCYGGGADLATCARRFDVSPAWQAFVGAEPALRAFASADMSEVYEWTTRLAAEFRSRLGVAQPLRPSAIVTWPDADGCALALLTAAGMTASGRNGSARVAFHIFNDLDDVERAAAALGR